MSTTRKPPAAKRAASPAPTNLGNESPPEPDLSRALALAMELMAIPGTSGSEAGVADYIRQKLIASGADPAAIVVDDATRRTLLKGDTSNLIFQLPGSPGAGPGGAKHWATAPRRLLMAHMDTVPICVGSQPRREGEFIASADPKTGLGADDRAGVAVVLSAALEILERGLPHPPLTFFWPVQEEIGLHGARHVRVSRLGKPRLAFNWDGGRSDKLTIGATGGYRLKIEITGLASHAGNAPEKGVSAIAIAGLAIASLVEDGWHGDIRRGRQRGTSNIGVIQGGDATNVVTEHVHLRAEARSHDPKFRARIVRAIERAFQRAARQVRSSTGKRGSVAIEGRLDYESFKLADDEPAVVAAWAATESIGVAPHLGVTNGGLDANWMTLHGIPTVTLGCGQENVHTTSERLDIKAFEAAARVALRLATSLEAGSRSGA